MPSNPKTTQLFINFCQQIAVNEERLYILGDFFEYWVGDDDDSPFIQQIIDILRWLSESGTQLYFLPGNRDFLIGSTFCESTHMQLLKDPTLINCYDNEKCYPCHESCKNCDGPSYTDCTECYAPTV